MKIGYLAKTYDQRSGGGRYAYSVVSRVRDLGHETVLLKELNDGPEGLPVLKPGLSFIKDIFKLRRLLKDCDVVHSFDVWPYALPAYFAILGTKKKLFISGVGTYSVAPLDKGIKKFLLTLALKRAQQIFCISSYVKDEMQKRVPLTNTSVVHMGFTPLPEISEDEKEKFREAYHISRKRRPILLTVGAVKHRKGQYNTVQAVHKLVRQYPDLTYIMVGTADEAAYISLIQSYVETHKLEKNVFVVPDATSDEALSFFYDLCDVFVMNSNNAQGHFEGFGLVFLEAAGFGKPVVGSRDCGIEDALKNGYNGYLTRQGNAQDIADKIYEVLDNKEELGAHSKEFVKNFSWEKTVHAYLGYYKS